jgi:hypothetical protein
VPDDHAEESVSPMDRVEHGIAANFGLGPKTLVDNRFRLFNPDQVLLVPPGRLGRLVAGRAPSQSDCLRSSWARAAARWRRQCRGSGPGSVSGRYPARIGGRDLAVGTPAAPPAPDGQGDASGNDKAAAQCHAGRADGDASCEQDRKPAAHNHAHPDQSQQTRCFTLL